MKIFYNLKMKNKIIIISLLLFVSLIIFGVYNKAVITSYLIELINSPKIKIKLVNIAKVAVPLKNSILMRSFDDKITVTKSAASCIFCNFSGEDFKEIDLQGVDLRYANLANVKLFRSNLRHINFRHANLEGADLSNNDFTGADLSFANLTGAELDGVNFSYKNMNGAILANTKLSNVNLIGADLRNVDFNEADLSNQDLTGAILINTNLSNANLDGVKLRYANLSGANLEGVNLSNKDLTGAILINTNLSNANLDGVKLRYANLSGANLEGVNLSNKDLTGVDFKNTNLNKADLSNSILIGSDLSNTNLSNTNLDGAILKNENKIEVNIKKSTNLAMSDLYENQKFYVTRYHFGQNKDYLATKEGFLFESENNQIKLVLDLNKNSLYPFVNNITETGLLGIAAQDDFVYVAYTSQNTNNELYSLVVDQYSKNFSEVKNIIKIDDFIDGHFGGNLMFDRVGMLYLSVGDGKINGGSEAQNLKSLKGKILRLDVRESKIKSEIVAYGMRNPWGGFIDTQNRMFIVQCGNANVEVVHILNDLYADIPANLGWPVFEGSTRFTNDRLTSQDVLDPIFENRIRPGCVTGGVYLSDKELFVLTDYYGTIRLLKQKENGKWYLFDIHKQKKFIWGIGFNKKTSKIFIAPYNLELEIKIKEFQK